MKEDTSALTRVNIADIRAQGIRHLRVSSRVFLGIAAADTALSGLDVSNHHYALAAIPGACGTYFAIRAVQARRDAKAREKAFAAPRSEIAE